MQFPFGRFLSYLIFFLQSFLAGMAASGALTSGLRLITKAAFDNSKDGFRKGAGMLYPLLILLLILKKVKNESSILVFVEQHTSDDIPTDVCQ